MRPMGPLHRLLFNYKQTAIRIAASALVPLAAVYRRGLRNTAFVAVTGSCGKSTTVKLLGHLLGPMGAGHAGDLGHKLPINHALAVLGLKPWSRYCVRELTAHTPGFLDAVLSFYRPQIAVVTAVGDDHLDSHSNRENIAREKGKIVECLPPNGTAILNADDPLVRAMADWTRARTILYGLSEDADLRASDVHSALPDRLSMVIHYGGQSIAVHTQLVGDFWSNSVLAATAVALSCGLSLQDCAERLATAPTVLSRMQPADVDGGITFIDNTQKNPLWGLPAFLRVVAAARAPRKIVVFGGSSQLAEHHETAYASMVGQALDVADLVYFAGSDTKWLEGFDAGEERERYRAFATTRDVNDHLHEVLGQGDLVFLMAGRNRVHLERVLLDRTEQVVCWREGCKIPRHCRACRWYRTAAPG